MAMNPGTFEQAPAVNTSRKPRLQLVNLLSKMWKRASRRWEPKCAPTRARSIGWHDLQSLTEAVKMLDCWAAMNAWRRHAKPERRQVGVAGGRG